MIANMSKASALVDVSKKRVNPFKELWTNKFLYLLALPAVVYTFIFSYLTLPYIVIAFEKFNYKTGVFSPFVGLKNFEYFFKSSWAWTVTRNTLVINILFLIVGTVCSIVLAIVLNEVKAKKFLKVSQSMMLFPYFISWVIVSYMLQGILGTETGLLNNLMGTRINYYSTPGYWYPILLILNIWKNTGYNTIVYLAAITGIDEGLYEAAYIDGATRFKRIIYITIPLLAPGFANSFMLSFIESVTDYSNPVVIGGGYKTLASQIYVQAIGNYKLQVGTSVAVILLAVTVVVFLVQRYLMRSKNYVALTGKASRERQLITEKRVALPINAICFLLTLCILLFYVFLILGGFFKSWGVDYSFSLDSFKYVISYTGKAIKDTTLIALTASPISAVLAMAVAYLVVRKRFFGRLYLEQSSLLGLAVPGTVFGLGYILAFNSKRMMLTNTWFVLGIVLAMARLPVGVRSGVASLQQIDPSIEEAGRDLGGSSNKVFWTITIPLIKTSFFSGLVFTFIKSMTAISAVIFLVSGKYSLLTTKIMIYVDKGRFGYAAAAATILIAIVFAVVGIASKALSKMGVSGDEIMSGLS